MSKVVLVDRANGVHSDSIGGVRVHNDTVLGIFFEASHMAHKVRRKFASKSSAVSVTPQKFRLIALFACNSENSEVIFGVFIHVFEILARACNDKIFTDKVLCFKSDRNSSNYVVGVEVLFHFLGFEQVTNITAVALVPAKTVHISGGFSHFNDERSVLNVAESLRKLFFNFTKNSHSYSP